MNWRIRTGKFEWISLGERQGFLTVTLKVSFKAFDLTDQEFKVALLPLSNEDAVSSGSILRDAEPFTRGRITPPGFTISAIGSRTKLALISTPAVSPEPKTSSVPVVLTPTADGGYSSARSDDYPFYEDDPRVQRLHFGGFLKDGDGGGGTDPGGTQIQYF